MKRFVSFCLCFILVFLSFSSFNSAQYAYAVTKQELEEEINRLNSEIKNNKDKLNSLSGQKKEKQAYLDTLEEQISLAEKKASALETQIQTIDNEIADFDKQIGQLKNEISIIEDEIKLALDEIKSTETKINAAKEELKLKLRTSYITGKQSTLKILMGSKNLASFLTRLEFIKRTSEEEKAAINDFKQQTEKLKKSKAKLEENKTKLDEKYANIKAAKSKSIEKKKELKTKQTDYKKAVSSLEKNFAAAEDFIKSLDKSSSVYMGYIKKLESEKAAADAEIDRIIRENMTTVPTETTVSASNGGETVTKPSTTAPIYNSADSWIWPLGGASTYISSGYGNRDASISGWTFHGGIDITGGSILDKPVYASRAGRVIAAVKTVDYWKGGKGYGNYVVIDHGDGFATLYGHCWKINVSAGQTVSKGQQISTVGSTGNSSGPHLHFEVRYNGVKQNPLNYVKR